MAADREQRLGSAVAGVGGLEDPASPLPQLDRRASRPRGSLAPVAACASASVSTRFIAMSSPCVSDGWPSRSSSRDRSAARGGRRLRGRARLAAARPGRGQRRDPPAPEPAVAAASRDSCGHRARRRRSRPRGPATSACRGHVGRAIQRARSAAISHGTASSTARRLRSDARRPRRSRPRTAPASSRGRGCGR